jgi:Sulfotransferase domain
MNFIDKVALPFRSEVYGRLIANKINIEFAVIGFPKCATTSIHKTLASSPNVYMPDFEVQVPSLARGWLKRPSNGIKLGIKNPNIMYEPHNFLALLKSNRNMKFIITMRNPTDWLFSFYQYRMLEIRKNKEWLKPILAKHPEFKNVTFADVVGEDKDFFGLSKKSGFFVDYLKEILNWVSPEQILILMTEEIAENATKAYEKIFQFLEIDKENCLASGIEANKNNILYDNKCEFKDQLTILADFYKPKNKELHDLLLTKWNYNNVYWQ